MTQLRDVCCASCVGWLDFHSSVVSPTRALVRWGGICAPCAAVTKNYVRELVAQIAKAGAQDTHIGTRELLAGLAMVTGHTFHPRDLSEILRPVRPRNRRFPDGSVRRGYSVKALTMILDSRYSPADIEL